MKKKILAVDDSQTMRDMLNYTLKMAGYDVKVAADGQIALDMLKNLKFDLIITDLNMPNVNGFELIKALRAMVTYKFVPILILTTEGDNAKKEEGKAAGATGWIVKPFNPEKLVEVTKKVCAIEG